MNRSQTYTAVIERCPVTGDYVGRRCTQPSPNNPRVERKSEGSHHNAS